MKEIEMKKPSSSNVSIEDPVSLKTLDSRLRHSGLTNRWIPAFAGMTVFFGIFFSLVVTARAEGFEGVLEASVVDWPDLHSELHFHLVLKNGERLELLFKNKEGGL